MWSNLHQEMKEEIIDCDLILRSKIVFWSVKIEMI